MKNVVRVENGSMIFGQGGSGGSGGHTIQNDSGTALPQESALQFVGAYSEDDSTNGKTKVNIIREMTKAQMDALSSDVKKGVIHTTDEPDNPANPISADDVTYGSGTVEDALDELNDTACVTGTLASTTGTPTAVYYPTGFDVNNCIVIGAMYEYAANTYAQYINNGTQRFDVILNLSAMSIIPRHEGALGKNVKIILKKFS